MPQAFYCRTCNVSYGAELRGRSCPACGEELIHGRVPASKTSRRAAAGSSVGRAVWDHILKRDVCAYCSKKLTTKEITIDHIQPKALGGSKGSWTNRTASCRPCNADKAHTPLLFFMLEQRGVDLSFVKTEEGNWPIPEGEGKLCATLLEEQTAAEAAEEGRKFMAKLAQRRFQREEPLTRVA